MEEEYKRIASPKGHSVFLDARENCVINGVEAVVSFDEESVNMMTQPGGLTVYGTELHITKLDLESGQVIVQGSIDGVEYSSGGVMHGKGVLSRMFR